VEFRESPSGRIALVTITVAGDVTLPAAHAIAGKVESEIKAQCPEVSEAIVHTEPRG
jgi:divalent metal cation (Fe/Co/Zn/Cd) transporter